MDFSPSGRCRELSERLERFMQDEVLPAEADYAAQLTGSPDWRQWRQPSVMEALKGQKRARRGCGTCSCRTPSTARD
ncbi:protein of unknown function [Burkholderia multivorans]